MRLMLVHVMLKDLMLISLVFNGPYQVLKAVDIDFRVHHALQILVLDLLNKQRVKFCFVNLTVECLRHGGFVCLICKFGVNLDKFRINLFLKIGMMIICYEISCDSIKVLHFFR